MNTAHSSETEKVLPELVIEAGRTERHYWREFWRYRELFGFLAWRDVKVRYKQTVLGIAWAVIQPLATVGIFSFVFGVLAGMANGDPRYPLAVMAAVLPWQLFATSVSSSSGSLIANEHLISKIYFPRLLIPMSSIGVALLDFVIVLALFFGMAWWFDVTPTLRILFLPVLIGTTLIIALGAGLWFSALMVRYRDFRFILTFVLQIGIFLSPIGYRTTVLPNWRDLLALNPMTGVMEGFRWCLLGSPAELDVKAFVLSVLIGGTLLATGLWYFKRTERSFADII